MQQMNPELHAHIKRPAVDYDDARGIITIDGIPVSYQFFSVLNSSEFLEKPVIISRDNWGIIIKEV